MAATQKFTNSGLVVYTKLSPNHSGQRTRNIDQIAIHHTAGKLSVESLGSWFAKSTTEASSNYGIGDDGRIAMYVEEKNRSWCTSSNAVDQRAVTIEVVNSVAKDRWPVSDKGYAPLIDLVTDICQRNNIKKLLWKGDKNLLNKVDQQNLVAHKFVTNKVCPGPYLFERFGAIANEVNKRLGANGASLSNTTVANLTAESSEDKIWNFLIGKGVTQFAAAGIMGNIYAESGLISKNLQNTFERSLGYTDDSYTAAVDNGTYKNFVHDKAGYGLCQWTFWSRKQGLLDAARAAKKSISDIDVQLEFLWKELSNNKKLLQTMNSAKSVYDASTIFLVQFEAPANQSDSVKNTRAKYSQGYYDKHASNTSHSASQKNNTVPYLVQVTTSVLNIRKGPGTNYGISGTIKNKGIYTIVEESTGTGAKRWGKLKSGTGWISLDYCQKK